MDDDVPIAPDVRSYTLEQFCERAGQLYDDNDFQAFVQFVLCGIDDDHQASIDVVPNRLLDRDLPSVLVDRDYDSVLGIDQQIRVHNQPLVIHPVAKFDDTLKSNVHLTYSFTNDTGSYNAPLHQIPNLGLGKWKLHNLVRVMFPELHGPDRKSHHLSKKEQVDFCEKGLLPTLQELLENRGGNLPPDYEAEMFRARKDNGQLAFGSRILPSWRVPEFGDCLRRHLSVNGVAWARNLVFVHQG
ncbi:hypothetical protein EST38_g13046 [Candolleomyces aberdarensis]|uniref:Uncharacterized protein n=1 Tax=Candolleomyces aberdarensis TaxID=2316362 RepID=A0A4V1Q1U5_9AGAR|nr:hypothetical protein EST38_g13046 [Candolleomyces aberdarensis]